MPKENQEQEEAILIWLLVEDSHLKVDRMHKQSLRQSKAGVTQTQQVVLFKVEPANITTQK